MRGIITDMTDHNRKPQRTLQWKRDGADWILYSGRRRFGRVIPDKVYPGMWRSIFPTGALSDVANLSWARSALLQTALRDLQYEHAHEPSNCPQNRGSAEEKSSQAAIRQAA
jgi:hypothetical protein